jgi:hypothetical protein
MKLASGKRIGQSGHELSAAVLFSFFIHVIFLFFAIFFYLKVTPRSFAPPFYDVKLVGLSGEPAPLPQTPVATPPVEPPQEKKPALKGKKAAPRAVQAKKSGMPDLARGKAKPAAEEERPAEAPAGTAPTPGGENVAVSTPQQDFKYAYYINAVRVRIGQHWSPPPDAPDAKARVIFGINRSGWVGEINLDADHSLGNFGFQQAAIRAIRASNPFPPLPEEFSKQTLEFSVDLKAE